MVRKTIAVRGDFMIVTFWAVNEFYCRANGSELGGTETGEYFESHSRGYKYVQDKYGVSDPDSPYSSYFIRKKTLNILDL